MKSSNNFNTDQGSKHGAVLCFGELLMRMSPQLGGEWISKSDMPVHIGGAELNVATALANWGVAARYCSALPDNYLSSEIISAIKEKNVQTSAMIEMGERIGIYYLPQGADLKHAGVIYDRAHSSFSELKPGMINWHAVMHECEWFHFSAITPALNESLAAVCAEALAIAKERGMKISVDLNYRSKLWKYGKDPVEVMPELVSYCDVIMGNIWSTQSLLGIKAEIDGSEGRPKDEMIKAATNSLRVLKNKYPMASTLAYTFRLDEQYWGMIQQQDEINVSVAVPITKVIDKVGSGDCFMAALIYGLYEQKAAQDIVDFASVAAVSKLQEKGDATSSTVSEIMLRLQQLI